VSALFLNGLRSALALGHGQLLTIRAKGTELCSSFQMNHEMEGLLTRRHATASISALLVMFVLASTLRLKAQKPTANEERSITDVVRTLLVALRNEDQTELNSVVTPDFYIFDNGSRFDKDSVMAFMKHLHASGKQIEWNITEPDVHVVGDVAWIAYLNKGTITTGQIKSDQSWLESGFLERKSGKWQLEFMQSTRIPGSVGVPK